MMGTVQPNVSIQSVRTGTELTVDHEVFTSNLSSLSVARCQMGDHALVLLANALASSQPQLTSLDVSANPFGERGTLALADLVKSNILPLASLNVSGGTPERATPLALTA